MTTTAAGTSEEVTVSATPLDKITDKMKETRSRSIDTDEEHYPVADILKKRQQKGQTQDLIKWESGYPRETWEPLENLDEVELDSECWSINRKKPRTRKPKQ